MAQWARHPAPMWRVKLVLAVLVLAGFLYSIEHIWGWPSWLTVNGKVRLQ